MPAVDLGSTRFELHAVAPFAGPGSRALKFGLRPASREVVHFSVSLMPRTGADRRLKPRFEVVGDLAGTIETVIALSLRDAGFGGVLADSPIALAVGGQHRVRFHCDGVQATAEVIVRHVRTETSTNGEQRFLLGLQFLSESPALWEVVTRWMSAQADTTC